MMALILFQQQQVICLGAVVFSVHPHLKAVRLNHHVGP